MFVSTYSTYVHNSNLNKTSKINQDDSQKSQKFDLKNYENQSISTTNFSSFPIDYIKQNNSFTPRFELLKYQHEMRKDEQSSTKTQENISLQQFSKFKTLNNAQISYSDNSKIFSFVKTPSKTIDQTPKIDKDEPQDIQELKKQYTRITMLNAYIANDNYYKITA